MSLLQLLLLLLWLLLLLLWLLLLLTTARTVPHAHARLTTQCMLCWAQRHCRCIAMELALARTPLRAYVASARCAAASRAERSALVIVASLPRWMAADTERYALSRKSLRDSQRSRDSA